MNAATKILIILADDLGWGNLSEANTPHILALMRESLVYRNAHAPVSWCSPTRWALMTGREPHMRTPQIAGAIKTPLIGSRATTLAKSMRAAGYSTGIFGKWHLGGSPLDYGFRTTFWFPNANVATTGPVTLYDQSRAITSTRAKFLGQICNRAVRYMTDTQGPWFAYVPLPTPHRPIVGSYAQWVGACDGAVGRLVEAAGPDAMVIFASDNGTEEQEGIAAGVPNPNRGWKKSLWDGGTRVPFCIRHPDIEPGETDQLVSVGDTYSTLGSMVGFAPVAGSVDIFGVGREYLITQDIDRRVAVRRADGWKLHVESRALYHLPVDPLEATPVADRPDIVGDLLTRAP